jgi:3-deoxy-7-phosphoheptulonate synthase
MNDALLLQPHRTVVDPGHLAAVRAVLTAPAAHQPAWADHPDLSPSRRRLGELPALVAESEVDELRQRLAAVATGDAVLLQAGDCAESFDECDAAHVNAKLDNLDRLSAQFGVVAGQDVLAVGRLAGQFAKPRSHPTERVGELELPSVTGHNVHSEAADPTARQHDPTRMLRAHRLSEDVLVRVDHRRREGLRPVAGHRRFGPWTSHEALLLDYEVPQLRPTAGGGLLLSSTHLPWVGERTRAVTGAHVALLAAVTNPVAAKIGPNATPDAVVGLCARLDPDRAPGRLTLIARMGHRDVSTRLAPIAAAVRAAGHPVMWLCDPMHGNTTAVAGTKTRRLTDIVAEVRGFRRALAEVGVPAGGLHLETSATEVTECIGGAVRDPRFLGLRYTTLCDPRLSPGQALEVINAWGAA